MIQMARDITGQWRAGTRFEEARAIQSWIKRRVRYVPDPHGAEMLSDPLTTIKNGGDCDDMAILACALLQAIGHDARIGAVTWKGKTDASHAVCVDLTANCVVDPVGNEPEIWPPRGFEVGSIRYLDKQGQMQSMNGLFSKLIKAVAKPFQSVFPAHTLLGKVMDPLGLTDPKRNLNLAGRVADVVGTAAAVVAGGWAIGAATAGTAGGFWATAAAGGSAVASGIGSAAGVIGNGLVAVLPALLAGGASGGAVAAATGPTAEQMAAWQQYGQTAGAMPGAAGGYSGGGGSAGSMLMPDGTPMPSSQSALSTYAVPLAIAAGVGLLLFMGNKRSAHV